MRHLSLPERSRFGAAPILRTVAKHGPAFMTWFAVVATVAGVAMYAVAILLL
jgi:hypothetical protein